MILSGAGVAGSHHWTTGDLFPGNAVDREFGLDVMRGANYLTYVVVLSAATKCYG
jgi:hypothetical protein